MQRIFGRQHWMMRLTNSQTPPSLFKSRLSYLSTNKYDIKTVGVVGMGLMGHGIAQIAASAGYDVVAVDMDKERVNSGMKRVQDSLNKLTAREIKKQSITKEEGQRAIRDALARISPTTDQQELRFCDLIIEAIIEDIETKRQFYEKLNQIAHPKAIFASNTSSLSISSFSKYSNRPSQVVGLHFFNPVQIMQLVEVIRTDATDPQVFEVCKEWVQSVGKHSVACKDTPGFIVNRLLIPYLSQALQLCERGDATMQDIDVSMQFGAGHPMGPITLADYVGLDTMLFILEAWNYEHPGDPAFIVPEILRQKVAAGKLGRKSGEGFYKWNGDRRVQ